MKKNVAGNTSLFDYEGKPSLAKSIPLGIQHVLAMIVGNVTPSIMVAAATGILARNAPRTFTISCFLPLVRRMNSSIVQQVRSIKIA